MKQSTTNSYITTTDINTTDFSIEVNASMFKMLTTNVYNDTILASIREWSTNAIDACLEAGHTPKFEVHLPTTSNAQFSVRDYGTGLAEKDITGLFCTFGASTKRDSNEYNGTFGIGRMSALAYASNFTVESFYNGMKITYLISLKDDLPVSMSLGTTPTSEPNGLRLSLPVQAEDIPTFHEKAKNLYKYFDHKPIINTELPKLSTLIEHQDFYLLDSTHHQSNVVLMGNVVYSLDQYQIRSNYDNLVLRVPLGSISITPGRESLTYDKPTVAFLVDFIKNVETIIINRANLSIKKEPTLFKQLLLFSSLWDKVPYALRPQLAHPSITKGTLVIDNYIRWSHPDFVFSLKTNYYQKTFKITDRRASFSDVKEADFIIVDQRQYSHVVKQYSSTSAVFIAPNTLTKDDFTITTPKIESYLQYLGITDYKKVSDFEKPEKQSRLTVGTIPLKNFGSSAYSAYDYDLATNTEEILYCPLKGSTYELTYDEREAIVSLRNYLSQTLGISIPQIYGIQQKYISIAEQLPKAHLAIDYLKKILTSNTITFNIRPDYTDSSVHGDYNSYNLHRVLQNVSNIPDDLNTAVQERPLHNYKQAVLDARIVSTLDSLFGITCKEPTYTYNFTNIEKKYPLLYTLRNDSVSTLSHYFKLEKHYHDTYSSG